jgi:hypothetical protein
MLCFYALDVKADVDRSVDARLAWKVHYSVATVVELRIPGVKVLMNTSKAGTPENDSERA